MDAAFWGGEGTVQEDERTRGVLMAEQEKQEVRGEAKEKLGEAMGDEGLERQGRADQAKAELKDAAEDVGSGLSEAADKAKESVEEAADKANKAFNK